MSMSLRKTGVLADKVYSSLLDDILHRRYVSGERLVEAEVAKVMDVSRTPVREAFSRLENDGLIRERNAGGYIVLSPSIEDLKEIFEVRRLLEPTAYRRVVEASNGEENEEFKQVYAGVIAAKGAVESVNANVKFRNFWISRVQNQRMKEVLDRFYLQVQLVRAATLQSAEARQRAREGAEKLLQTYLDCDGDAAESAMRDFVDMAYRFFEQAEDAGILYRGRN